jgi:Fe2+ transport system protein FeoA
MVMEGSGAGIPRLGNCSRGDRVLVTAIGGELPLRDRLRQLGVRQGGELTVLETGRQGPLVVSVLDSRIALDRDLADLVRIRHLEDAAR